MILINPFLVVFMAISAFSQQLLIGGWCCRESSDPETNRPQSSKDTSPPRLQAGVDPVWHREALRVFQSFFIWWHQFGQTGALYVHGCMCTAMEEVLCLNLWSHVCSDKGRT